ncbi:MAG: hypothetical protein WA705_11795 [Candidatus Ozemobacteraceae bacterium]
MLTDYISSIMTSSVVPTSSADKTSPSITTGDDFSKTLQLASSAVSSSTTPSTTTTSSITSSATPTSNSISSADSTSPSTSSIPSSNLTEASATEDKTKLIETKSDPVNFGGFSYHFSFFMRLSSDIGKLGKDILSQFQNTTEHVGTTFLQQTSGQTDPVGSYLQGTQKAILEGIDDLKSYLGSLMTASNSGFGALSSCLESAFPTSSTSSTKTGSSNDFSPQSIFFSGGNTAYEIARLRLSASESNPGISVNNFCRFSSTTSTENVTSSPSSSSTTSSSAPASTTGAATSSSTASNPSKSYRGQNLFTIASLSLAGNIGGGRNLKIIKAASTGTSIGSLRTDPLPSAASNSNASSSSASPTSGTSSDQVAQKFLEAFLQFVRKLREDSSSDNPSALQKADYDGIDKVTKQTAQIS